MRAPAKNKFQSAAVALVLAGLVVAALALVYFYATPKSYRATARIKLERRDWVHGQSTEDAQNPYDPHLAPAECQVLRSNIFFDRVATNLGLAQVWAKRNGQSAPLSADETRARLYAKTDISPLPNSTMLQIIVTSDDADETANIANEFARLYMDYRQTQRSDTIHDKVDPFQDQWELKNQKMMEAQVKLMQIKQQIRRQRATNNGPVFYDSGHYEELQAGRVKLDTQTVQLRDQLKELKSLPAIELPNVLSSLDTNTNSPLNNSLIQLQKANNNLAVVGSDHGPDTAEYKDAKALADGLDKRVARDAAAVLTTKEAELASSEAALTALDAELKKAKPSSQPDTELFQNPTFAKAYGEWRQAQQDRDALRDKLKMQYMQEAIKPVVITAELVDSADAPSKPFMPDRNVFLGAMGGGGVLSLAGLGLFLFVQKARNKAPKN